MTLLGTLTGTGRVLVKGKAVGDADYHIDIHEDIHGNDRPAKAQGAINASRPVIKRLEAGEPATLALQEGGSVEFVTTRADWIAGHARITVAGPVPGFS